MKLIKCKSGKKDKALAATYQNYLGFRAEKHEVTLSFTEDIGQKDVYYDVVMTAAEALQIASWAIRNMKGKIK